ncbi:MAG: SLBB domain-containing protein [Balneolaceae bacterium]
MPVNRFLSVVFCFSLVFGFPKLVQAQNNSTDNQTQNSSNLNSYFVDEAGLQLGLTTTPLDEFIDPETYVLGPYDVISIYGSGNTEFTYRALTINASGDILVPIVGKISLKDMTLFEAQKVLQVRFDKSFKGITTEVTLDRLRPINVYLGGNIPKPGRYIIPAGTRFDALITGFPINEEIILPLVDEELETTIQASAARPSFTGLNFDRISAETNSNDEQANSLFNQISSTYDLRLLKVTRKDGSEVFIDLSGYFNSGNKEFAPYISDGDQVTLIEHSQNRFKVSISGAVNNPFVGSYRTDDTFNTLLKIAGSFSPEADSSSIVVIKNRNGSTERLSISSSDIQNYKVQPGDQFIIPFNEQNQVQGTVTIEGEVNLPGIFSIESGVTTLQEALQKADGLTDDALPNGAYLIRKSLDSRGVTSTSSINMSGLTRASDQFLEGFDYMQLQQALDPNKMSVNLSKTEVLARTKVMNGDRIYIPKNEHTISMLGQVNEPGFYTFDENLLVSDYLSLADGVTIAADKERVFVIKAGSRAWYAPNEVELESGDIIFVDRIPFEDVSTGKNYAVQIQQLKNNRTQLIISGLGALASVITAYVAIRRL